MTPKPIEVLLPGPAEEALKGLLATGFYGHTIEQAAQILLLEAIQSNVREIKKEPPIDKIMGMLQEVFAKIYSPPPPPTRGYVDLTALCDCGHRLLNHEPAGEHPCLIENCGCEAMSFDGDDGSIDGESNA